MKFISLFVIIILTLHGMYVNAQCTTVTGVVLDKQTQEPLPGANIFPYHDKSKGTSTNAEGKFELSFKTENRDSLVISFIGYDDVIIPLFQTCDVLVELTSSEISLDEVIIKSEKLAAEEFIIKRIRKLDIYTNPSAKADPLLAVNSTPSATTTDESANISLRGSSPSETGIYLNNVPINDAVRYAQLNGIGTFSIFNTALMSQVQVFPGNPPLEFGGVTSGLIALSTDEVIPDKKSNTVSITLSSIGFYTQRKITKSSSLTTFSNYQPGGPIRWINKKALDRLKGFSSMDLGLHYFLKVDNRTTLKIFNYSNKESFRYQTYEPTYSGIFNQEKMRNFSVINLRHRLKRGEISWNNGLSFSKAAFTQSTINTKLWLNDLFTSLNYQYFGDHYEFKAGFSYDYRGSDFNGQFPRYEFALGDQFPIDSISQSQSVKVPEGYTYFKYNLTSKWIAGIGVRKNIRMHNQTNYLSGQLNINYKASPNWSFISSVGRYNKFALTQGEEFSSGHIQTDQYSMDVSFKKSDKEGSISVFYKRGKQQSTITEIAGIELYSQYKFNDHFRAQLSFTSLNAIEKKEELTYSSPYDIHYFIRGNLEYKFGGTWTATTVFLFRQGSFYEPIHSANLHSTGVYEPIYSDNHRLPSYNRVDISLSKMMILNEHISAVVFASINNVTDFKNVRGYQYNFDYTQKSEDIFSGRTLYFGCVVNF